MKIENRFVLFTAGIAIGLIVDDRFGFKARHINDLLQDAGQTKACICTPHVGDSQKSADSRIAPTYNADMFGFPNQPRSESRSWLKRSTAMIKIRL